jgi:hypothetical protein
VRFVEARVDSMSPTGRRAMGGNREAWDDGIREVAAFFREHL